MGIGNRLALNPDPPPHHTTRGLCYETIEPPFHFAVNGLLRPLFIVFLARGSSPSFSSLLGQVWAA